MRVQVCSIAAGVLSLALSPPVSAATLDLDADLFEPTQGPNSDREAPVVDSRYTGDVPLALANRDSGFDFGFSETDDLMMTSIGPDPDSERLYAIVKPGGSGVSDRVYGFSNNSGSYFTAYGEGNGIGLTFRDTPAVMSLSITSA